MCTFENFKEFWERICFFSVDENESLPSHLWQLPCSGQLSLWRNISHKSHTDLLQTVWKCSLQSRKCFFGLKEIVTRRRRGVEERSSSTAEVAGGSFPARLTAGRQGWGRPAVDIQTCALSSLEVLISTQRNLTQRIIIHSSFRENGRSALMYWVIFTSAWITEKQNVLVKCQPWAWRTILHKFKVHIFELKQSTTGSREDPVLWKNNRKWRVSTKYRIMYYFTLLDMDTKSSSIIQERVVDRCKSFCKEVF